MWDPLYVCDVKGHIPRSKIIRAQVVKFTSFEKVEV